MRIIQLSDTHLSVEHDDFAVNATAFAEDLAKCTPDLFIHTGDLSMDGAMQAHDLDLAKRWNDLLPAEVLSLPGNHDVGDLPTFRPDQPVNDERLARWRTLIGPDRWARDVGGWRLVGLNAMLLGSGHADEDAQFEWLASALETDLPIAVFLHKPLCIDAIGEDPCGYWTVAPAPRRRLWSLLERRQVRLIASGHLHIQRQKVIDGVSHVWSPAASFVVGAAQQDLGGERVLGYVEHDFTADTVTSRFVRPDGAEDRLFDPVAKKIYAPKPA
jgi:3',5'-cyclic AMP phosphodiesterase CpdA